jgi:carbon-monoxide dehydrogenase medium subunit
MLTMRDGVCERARLTIVGMGEGPFRARTVEDMLTDAELGPKQSRDVFAEAAAKVSAAVEPTDDVHASASYRRHLAGVMTVRALETALARAGGRPIG